MDNNIYVIGDLHGTYQPVRDFYQRNQEIIHTGDTLICLGDFGAQFFFNKRDWKYKHQLSKFPFIYFVIRGNHEERASICAIKNPTAWHTETYFNNIVLVENEFPQIKYALDKPAIYQIAGYKTLIFPGAYSVDKWYRLQNDLGWFPQEQLNEDEMRLGESLAKEGCDIVLSHTCPAIYMPTDLFLPMIDQSMVDNTMERYLGHIEFTLNYKAWLWGHYHAFRDYPRTDGKKKLMLFNQEVVNLIDYVEQDYTKIL